MDKRVAAMVVQDLLKRKRRATKRVERVREERRCRQAFEQRQAMERFMLY